MIPSAEVIYGQVLSFEEMAKVYYAVAVAKAEALGSSEEPVKYRLHIALGKVTEE